MHNRRETHEIIAFVLWIILFGILFFAGHKEDKGAVIMNTCMGIINQQEQEMCIGDIQLDQWVRDWSPDLSWYYE